MCKVCEMRHGNYIFLEHVDADNDAGQWNVLFVHL